MAKKKLGAFSIESKALDKPTSIDASGNFFYPSDVHAKGAIALRSLASLDVEKQISLATVRIKAEPNFKMGILNSGSYTKAEVLDQVNNQTELGQMITLAEMNYCDEFNAQLANPKYKLPVDIVIKPVPVKVDPIWQKVPKKLLIAFKSIALFCEDTTDNLTNMAATYRKAHVHPVFAAQGFEVKVLQGVEDVRFFFANEAKKGRVVYISGVGHGAGTLYTGHLGNRIIQVGGYDAAEVKGKIIHLLSCQTAKSLGPDMVAKGAKSYFGYFENFVFNFDVAGTPVNEIELFWKADSQIDISLACGRTVEQAHWDAIAKFNWAIAQVPNTGIASNLTWDRNYLRDGVIGASYGSKTAVLPKQVYDWLVV